MGRNLIHAIVVLVAGLVGHFFGTPALLALAAAIFFTGREIAQAEYRWIQQYGAGHRANMPWWGSVDYRVWDIHSLWWNLMLPWIICIVIITASLYCCFN